MSTQIPSSTTSHERQRSPRLYIVLLVILCVLFVVGYLQRLSTLDEIQRQVAAMQERIAASEQRRADLKVMIWVWYKKAIYRLSSTIPRQRQKCQRVFRALRRGRLRDRSGSNG
jgi:hypothetical protein